MKISEQWLRYGVNPPLETMSSEALAHQLTMAGLEVDSLEPVAPAFSGVIVGEVVELTAHPDAERLKIAQVNVSDSASPLQIVCGAPNVAVGKKVAVAMIGAELPHHLNIKKGKLRGVESFGMLCGASELGLDDGVDGLLLLPDDAPLGQDLRTYLQLDDRIIELSITPNRGDCLSLLGLSRELAALNILKIQSIVNESFDSQTISSSQPVKIEIQDSKSCPRYCAQVIRGVNTQQTTPLWIQQVLSRSGIRSHSILVDITNYVMLELGQPLHAFDYAKMNGPITVRQAKVSETLELLNGQTVTLTDDTLVIADAVQVLALAGVMGGQTSSVQADTQDILLESAFFNPLAIAGRARRYGLHTDASQRFERGVDFNLPQVALNRATSLIVELAGGQAEPAIIAEQLDQLPKRLPIALTLNQVQHLLGFAVEGVQVDAILRRLGMHVTALDNQASPEGWHVIAPSWRFDITIAEDLIEEVARIYGYDNIPFTLPHLPFELSPYAERLSLPVLRQNLVTLGYQEAISFSFSDAKLERLLNAAGQPLALVNPISSDLAVMRTTLLSSLLPVLQYNVNRQQERVRLFEMGLRFNLNHSSDNQTLSNPLNPINLLVQTQTLALIATGSFWPEQWQQKPKEIDFLDIKHDVEQVLATAQLSATYRPSARTWLHPGQSADIITTQGCIGYVGCLHPSISSELGLGRVWVAELDLEALTLPFRPKIGSVSRFPSVRRDIALVVPLEVTIAQLETTIYAVGGPELKQCLLFDVYSGQGIGEGARSLAFALIWQNAERTLEDNEIKEGMQRVIETLAQTHNAILRTT